MTKKIGQRNTKNKVSTEWLKSAGFLDTKDQDAINYIFVPPKKEAADAVKTEIENTDLKNENLTTNIKTKNEKPAEKIYGDETIKILDNIAVLEPDKNARIAAKKISQKYKKIRDAKRFKILGKILKTIETKDGNIIEVVVPPSKILIQKAAKKIK